MDKNTIFFSHSSKDKNTVLLIKDRIDRITGKTLNIFMSSDGQSIPLGTNWIHKVEDGLNSAKIMFVFVTKNSLSSGWIYFEAGHAYSKGIRVIPIGIGVDIASLNPPLNLLQGFNIISEESLNNFIDVINKEFNYRFEYNFDKKDYLNIIRDNKFDNIEIIEFENLIEKIECIIYKEIETSIGEVKEYNIEEFFNKTIRYLEEKSIEFAIDEDFVYDEIKELLFNGIKAKYDKGVEEKNISFSISKYNFVEVFSLMLEIFKLFDGLEDNYIRVYLNEEYSIMKSIEDISSIFFKDKRFKVNKYNSFEYDCNDLGLKIYINQDYENSSISIGFNNKNLNIENIIKLIDRLYNIGFIFKNIDC